MGYGFSDIAFTPRVKELQAAFGSRAHYARREGAPEAFRVEMGEAEAAFIAARDSFYMATVGETGWPYVQHRGGPKGFLRTLGPKALGFADLSGNRQYVSLGNLLGDDRVSLFLMDYANRRRLKIFGRARLVGPEEADLLARLALPDYQGREERAYHIAVEAFDWNCPQHITERYDLADVETATAALRSRVAYLEAELSRLKGG